MLEKSFLKKGARGPFQQFIRAMERTFPMAANTDNKIASLVRRFRGKGNATWQTLLQALYLQPTQTFASLFPPETWTTSTDPDHNVNCGRQPSTPRWATRKTQQDSGRKVANCSCRRAGQNGPPKTDPTCPTASIFGTPRNGANFASNVAPIFR